MSDRHTDVDSQQKNAVDGVDEKLSKEPRRYIGLLIGGAVILFILHWVDAKFNCVSLGLNELGDSLNTITAFGTVLTLYFAFKSMSLQRQEARESLDLIQVEEQKTRGELINQLNETRRQNKFEKLRQKSEFLIQQFLDTSSEVLASETDLYSVNNGHVYFDGHGTLSQRVVGFPVEVRYREYHESIFGNERIFRLDTIQEAYKNYKNVETIEPLDMSLEFLQECKACYRQVQYHVSEKSMKKLILLGVSAALAFKSINNVYEDDTDIGMGLYSRLPKETKIGLILATTYEDERLKELSKYLGRLLIHETLRLDAPLKERYEEFTLICALLGNEDYQSGYTQTKLKK